MVLYAVLRYDVAYRTTVDGEQQRSQYRSSRDADVEAHGWWLIGDPAWRIATGRSGKTGSRIAPFMSLRTLLVGGGAVCRGLPCRTRQTSRDRLGHWPVCHQRLCKHCPRLQAVSAVYAVVRCPSVCLSVRPSVTFLYSVNTNKRVFEIFSPWLAHHSFFHTKRYGNILTGTPPNGDVECRWDRQKSRLQYMASSRVVNDATAKCYTQLRRTVASWWHWSMVNGVVYCSRKTDGEVFMTRILNVTPKTKEHNVIVLSGKSEVTI